MKLDSIVCGVFALPLIAAADLSGAPVFDVFGTLSGATFSGSGIPNTSVAITSVSTSEYQFTVGLTAVRRYEGQAVLDDSAGTFYSQSGGDLDNALPANNLSHYAKWNLGWYINFTDFQGGPYQGYSFSIFSDTNPATGNSPTSQFNVPFTWFSQGQNGVLLQNSWNLGMNFAGWNGGPAGGFNPNASGEYSFTLAVYGAAGELGKVSVDVVVNPTGTPPVNGVPDESRTVVLTCAALAGLVGLRRRFLR